MLEVPKEILLSLRTSRVSTSSQCPWGKPWHFESPCLLEPRPTSAYLDHYNRALASWAIPPIGAYGLVAFSLLRESHRWVIPVTVLLKKRAKWSTKDTEDQPFLSLLHRSLAWDERTRVTLRCERQERTVPQVDRVVLSKACCAPSALTGTQSPASDDNSRRRSRRSYDDIPWY
jgi:hypothetical protein